MGKENIVRTNARAKHERGKRAVLGRVVLVSNRIVLSSTKSSKSLSEMLLEELVFYAVKRKSVKNMPFIT